MLAKVSFSEENGRTDTLVAAVPDKRILVLRLLSSQAAQGHIRLLDDPGGSASDITSKLFSGNTPVMDLAFGRAGGVVTSAGKALGFTSQFVLSTDYSIVIWYDLVD